MFTVPSSSIFSSVLASCNPENPEEKFRLYMQIIDFFKGFCFVNAQLKEVGQSGAQGDLRWPPLGGSRKGSGGDCEPDLGWVTPPEATGRGCPFILSGLLHGCDFSRMHPVQWKTSRETEGRDRGMDLGADLKVATRSQGLALRGQSLVPCHS